MSLNADSADNEYSEISIGFQQIKDKGIVIAPWFAMDEQKKRISSTLRLQLKTYARALSWHYKPVAFWIDVGVARVFQEHAFYEVLLSTAAYLSYLRLGTLVMTEQMVAVSHSLLRNYLDKHGSADLLAVYARVMAYLNLQVVLHYGQVAESVFVSGAWHRPWIDYSLERDLESSIQHGFMKRISSNGIAAVGVTEAGVQLYRECREDLEQCGYMKQRDRLMRVMNFTYMDDYEDIMRRFTREFHDIRRRLIKWSNIQPGMKVLELGCGSATLTLDDGLYHAVLPNGKVVATDPALGMLRRARTKLDELGVVNVDLQRASAEAIPFPDNTFDSVTGMLFLEFTNIPNALQEIHRVTKPGGTFTTFYGLNFDTMEPFFEEWFGPIFKSVLMPEDNTVLPDRFVVPQAAEAYFDSIECHTGGWNGDFSHVEDVVKFLVRAVTMPELREVPWGAREPLFAALVAKGYEVKKKYGSAAMKKIQPAQWFKGVVKK